MNTATSSGSVSSTINSAAHGKSSNNAFSWSIDCPETILVGDTISVDGRFVLHSLACQVLQQTQPPRSNNNKRQKQQLLLWLNFSSISEQQVASTMKKMGCNDPSLSRYIQQSSRKNMQQKQQSSEQPPQVLHPVTIISVPSLINDIILKSSQSTFNEYEFMTEKIYHEIKQWLNKHDNNEDKDDDYDVTVKSSDRPIRWIIIEDVTSLSRLVGDRLTYCLIHSIRSLSVEMTTNSFGLMIRCSIDYDHMIAKSISSSSSSSMNDNGNTYTNWIGAGGKLQVTSNTEIPWERTLVELVDTVIDVIPLATGYSRDVHGRIIVTKKYEGNTTTNIYNFCMYDTHVQTILIKSLA